MWLHPTIGIADVSRRGSYRLEVLSNHYPEDGDIADDVTDNHKRETNKMPCAAEERETSTRTRRTGGRRVAVDDEVFLPRVDVCEGYGSSDGLRLLSP